MTTGYYLPDNPNPNAPQRGDGQYWGYSSMNADPRCIVVHTAESMADLIGDDLGAENVARWFTTNTVAASYHTLVDSDSTVRCLPAGLDGTVCHTAFHAYGVNSWTLGLSLAMRADSWPTLPQPWASKILNRAVNEAAAWCVRWGIPAARITFAEAQAGGKGFMAHADTSPEDRSDPGAGFPWDLFLRLVGAQLDLGTSNVGDDPLTDDDKKWISDQLAAQREWLQGQLNAISGTVSANANYLAQWSAGLSGEHKQILARLEGAPSVRP